VRVEDLTLGDAPPVINAVKLYDTKADEIIVELETVWDSKARLRLGVSFTEGGSLYAPVEVAGIRFQGVIRVIMAPMLPGPPFVGAMAFSSALAPNIDFRIKVLGGEVSAIPGLRETLQARRDALANQSLVSCAYRGR
jgi:Ca2+-dependent lipid-binding protein